MGRAVSFLKAIGSGGVPGTRGEEHQQASFSPLMLSKNTKPATESPASAQVSPAGSVVTDWGAETS